MVELKAAKYGVHSEVGQLRKVMVCAPGRAHQRLTPSNCDSLLFDDVLWVDNAKRDHFDFMQKMRDRGIEVVEMHNLLAETLAVPEGKKWILDNQVVPNQVGLGLVDEIRSYLEGLSNLDLSETLIGGLSTEEFPEKIGGEQLAIVKDAAGVTEYLLPPLPNTLYTRDTTCWIYGGCTLNPLYWPARHEETILTERDGTHHRNPGSGCGSGARQHGGAAARAQDWTAHHGRALAVGDHPCRAASKLCSRRAAERPAITEEVARQGVRNGVPHIGAQVAEAVRVNAEARLRALKLGLLIMAALAFVTIIPAGRLPSYRPGELPADPPPSNRR